MHNIISQVDELTAYKIGAQIVALIVYNLSAVTGALSLQSTVHTLCAQG